MFYKIKNHILTKFNLIDLVVILIFALFACLYHLNRVAANSPTLFMNDDASNLAGVAAFRDHPDLLSGDEYLVETNKMNYPTIHLPIIRTLTKFTGDYISAFLMLVGIHVFAQGTGFYFFGRVLFKSRFWAVLLAIVTLMPVTFGKLDFWGIYFDPLPRISFHAVLPYLLTAAVYFRNTPFTWPWILGLTGISTYIHPLSAPCWGAAFWVGFWIFQPARWNLRRRIGYMILCGVIFMVPILPFATGHLNRETPISPQNYNIILSIMQFRYAHGLFNTAYVLKDVFTDFTFMSVFLFGLAGMIFVYLSRGDERKKVLMLMLWSIVIIILSAGLSFIIQGISYKYKIAPFRMEFVRNFKYLFLFALIFSLWPFVLITRSSRDKKKRIIVFTAGFLLFSGWSVKQMYEHLSFFYQKGYSVFSSANTNKLNARIDILNALKRLTPPRSKILVLFFPDELSVRYYAMRPLAYSFKDFPLHDENKMIEWFIKTNEILKTTKIMQERGDDRSKINAAFVLSRKLNAQFLLVGRYYFSNSFSFNTVEGIIYSNKAY
ncbi:MAG: hypothetical protein ABH858_03285, partial [Candidatus Omnitrophota bacterium]